MRLASPVVATRLLLLLALAPLPFASSAAQAQGRSASARPRRHAVGADDGQTLTVWSRRPAGRPRGAILLLHGRTWSSLPNFDLHVKGQRVSLMEAFAARGYSVYALDQRGYGATPRDSTDWLTPTRAYQDAAGVLSWIAEREHRRPALLGYSQGSMTALLTALRDSARMSAVVLYGFPLDLGPLATARAIAADRGTPERRATTPAGAAEDFITPESTPDGVKEAYVKAAVAADPVRADWRGESMFASMDAGELRVPALVINGERDPYASHADLARLMRRIGGVDHSWVVLARADHVAHLERQDAFVDAVVGFLEQVRTARAK